MRRKTSRFHRLPSCQLARTWAAQHLKDCDVMIIGHRSMIRHASSDHPDEHAALGAGRQAEGGPVVWDPRDQRERRREGRRCRGD